MPIKLEYNFSKKKFSKKIFADFKKINLNQKNIKEILSSFEKNYKFNFDLIKLKKYKKKNILK